jgi:putative ABC transport system permease protein
MDIGPSRYEDRSARGAAVRIGRQDAWVMWSRRRSDEDFAEEIRANIALETDRLIAEGMSSDEARSAARHAFGNVTRAQERFYEGGRMVWLEDLQRDIRYAFRMLTKSPTFTIVAVLTLALGIGANAAIFTALKSVLLDALPYADADRLVRVYGRLLDSGVARGPLSAGTIHTIAERQQSFESIAAFQPSPTEDVYGGDERPRIVQIAWTEPALFDTLGITPAFGRTLQNDDRTSGMVPLSGGQVGPDTAGAVMLTDNGWQRLFAGDRNAVGRSVVLNGISRTIVGILPRGFVGPMGEADFYVAFDLGPVVANPVNGRRSQWLGLVGRLKPGTSHETSQREMANIWADLVRQYPEDNGSLGILTTPLRDALVGDTRRPLLMLMASALFVLLIASANLAGAVFSRCLARRKEFAVRVSLGGHRGRLIRQLLVETIVLAVIGGSAGLWLGQLLLSVVNNGSPRLLPDYANVSLDTTSILVIAALTLSTGLISGLIPAVSISRLSVRPTLHAETRGATESPRSRGLRGVLVATQLALCATLLTGAALLTRSLLEMRAAPLGFDPNGVLTATVRLPPRDYPRPEVRARFMEALQERIRLLPGVESVAVASSVPTAVRGRVGFSKEGAAPSAVQPFVLSVTVSDDYFRMLHIALRDGRLFDAQDRVDTPPTVVISEGMARTYWPNGKAVGSRIRMGANPNSPWVTIIGVVGDVRNDVSRPDVEEMAYRSTRQLPLGTARILLRTAREPAGFVRAVERELAGLDPNLPLEQAMPLRAVLDVGFANRRFPVMLVAAFGVLALLLASIGVYGLFSSMAEARQREFGVRRALGSQGHEIVRLMIRQGAAWMAIGLGGSVIGITLVAQLLRGLLYGVSPFDPVAIASAIAVLAVCAMLAVMIPVRRATRVDPLVALRCE